MADFLNQPVELSDRCVEVCRRRVVDRERQEDIAANMAMCQQRVSQHLATARKRCPAFAMLERIIFGEPRRRRIA